jgi:hypothetical protein
MMSDEGNVYSDRYVLFLDILGFSNIVRQSEASPNQATGMIKTLENIATIDKDSNVYDVEKDDFRSQSFSDCVVISENASPIGLFSLLASVTLLTLELLGNGVFTRGGIAKGKLHHSDKVVFGPAMLEAYRLESSIARYPRILIDKATHLDFQQPEFAAVGKSYERSPSLILGDDGPPFLDTLLVLRHIGTDFDEDIPKYHAAIQTALDASIYEPNHFDKYRWLANYWNQMAVQRGTTTVRLPVMGNLRL